MDTTQDLKQTNPRHVLTARADEELAHAYDQITRAGEEIARAEQQLSKLEHAQRRAVPGKRPSPGGPAVRGFIGVMLAGASVSRPSFGSRPTAMRPGRLSQGGRHSSSQLDRCRSKIRGSPRGRAQLAFRWPRRIQHLHNRQLRLRPPRNRSRRPRPCLPIRCSCSSRWRAISRPWGKESSSSRPASNKWPATM
jgi:hypothetical protein